MSEKDAKKGSMAEFMESQKELQANIQNQNRENSVLIAYASQTGVSELLAYRTTDILIQSGLTVDCKPFWLLQPDALKSYLYVLFLVSSTGRGNVPQRSMGLIDGLPKDGSLNFEYALFGLGDSRFRTFCGGAETADKALQEAGAKPFLPITRADAKFNLTEDMWKKWLTDISKAKGFELPPFEEDEIQTVPVKIELVSSKRLDNPAMDLKEVHAMDFKLLNEEACFRSGDILKIRPPMDKKDKRERSYSIGSNRDDGNLIRLTVALEENGQVSHHLIENMKPGDVIEAGIESHPHFNIPLYSAEPVIMVARGTGIAPFRGFLEDIERRPRVTWLFFSNTHSQGNDYYRSYWEEMYKRGKLIYLDFVFDDETDLPQDRALTRRLVENGEKIHKLVHDESALIYVCGKTELLNRDVKNALLEIHKEHGDGLLDPEAWYDQLLFKKQIRMDVHSVFD